MNKAQQDYLNKESKLGLDTDVKKYGLIPASYATKILRNVIDGLDLLPLTSKQKIKIVLCLSTIIVRSFKLMDEAENLDESKNLVISDFSELDEKADGEREGSESK